VCLGQGHCETWAHKMKLTLTRSTGEGDSEHVGR